MLIYLSGPMTGIEGFNYAAFNAAAARLRELDIDVINPAETAGGVTHLPREAFMRIDVGYVQAAQAVIVMEGWRNSKGAKLEAILADSLGIPVFTYDPRRGIGSQILLEDWFVAFEESPVQLVQKSEEPTEPEDMETDGKIIPMFSAHPQGVN